MESNRFAFTFAVAFKNDLMSIFALIVITVVIVFSSLFFFFRSFFLFCHSTYEKLIRSAVFVYTMLIMYLYSYRLIFTFMAAHLNFILH